MSTTTTTTTTTHTLTGKAYLVTGAASGIGLATARTLLTRGASVTFCDFNGVALEEAVSSLSLDLQRRALWRAINVTDRAAVRAALEATKQAFGRVDGVANAAGTAGHRLGGELLWEVSDSEFDFIMGTNTRGVFTMLSEALKPDVLTSGGGSFVNVGSSYSERGFLKGAALAASKHAALGLVKSAALEVAGRGIRVNTVQPGSIDTPMHRAKMERWGDTPVPAIPLNREGQAQEVANVICFLLSEESGYVTGSSWGVDGGSNA